MASEGGGEGAADGFGCGFVCAVVLLLAGGYAVMKTDNPVRDWLKQQAFEMGVEHVKERVFGK